MDPGMNQLLKWSLENSEQPSADSSATADPEASRPSGRPLNADALTSLFGGPTDADMMKESMAIIVSPDISLDNKLVAFENFEQLIEQVDNANNMEPLGLWPPLVSLLEDEQADLRRFACWCIGTAVQNNSKCQEKPVSLGIIPSLVKLAIDDSAEAVRRKAIYALSSEVRNFQPGLNEALKALPKSIVPEGAIDAGAMDAIDRITDKLREDSTKKAAGS